MIFDLPILPLFIYFLAISPISAQNFIYLNFDLPFFNYLI